MKKIIIEPFQEQQRFSRFLEKYFSLAPKGFYYKMLRKKRIVLNGRKADGSERLHAGDEVTFYLSEETLEKFSETLSIQSVVTKKRQALSILYEDAHVLFVNKPVGLLSQKAKSSDISLVDLIIDYMLFSGQINQEQLRSFRPGICNRLDRNTSGIVVAGKTIAGLQRLGEVIRQKEVKKFYRCPVVGHFPKKMEAFGYLRKDSTTNRVEILKEEHSNTKPIATRYKPVFYGKDITMLEAELLTGKSHQIRAQLAWLGFPIIGDEKYGNPKVNGTYRKRTNIKGQLLHGHRMVFPQFDREDPLYGLSRREVIAPLPANYRLFQEAEKLWEHGTPEGFGDQP